MAVTIGSNISALKAQSALRKASDQISKTYERLSSGQRINTASDDAAGLAVASSLELSGRVFTKAIGNINDGISALSIADGAMQSLSEVIIRLKELAEQSANGTYSSTQRIALDNEAQALITEYSRVVSTTKFNGVDLINGNFNSTLQVGLGGSLDDTIRVSISNVATMGNTGLFENGTYSAPVSYAGGGGILTPQIVDINGDNKLDLITTEVLGNTVSIYVGNGDGTFKARTTLGAGTNPGSLSVNDFDGDGKKDLLVLAGLPNILLFHGNGDGTFNAPRSTIVGFAPADMAVGYINNDSALDFVTIQGGIGNVISYMNDGTGGFNFADNDNPGGLTGGVVLGDFNGDGRADYATTLSGSNAVLIYTGAGDGTFTFSSTYYTAGTSPELIRSGDVNGDGYLDVITGDQGGSGNVSVLLGNSNGTFKAAVSYATGASPKITLTDLDGDGANDIVTSDFGGSTISVLFGNGNGTFKARITSFAAAGPGRNATGDLNGDTLEDIITTNYTAGSMQVLLGNGDARFVPPTISLRTAASALSALSTMDTAVAFLSNERGKIGAVQSRLQIAGNSLQTSRIAYASSHSLITSADIATESARLVQTQILQQTAVAILAQAKNESNIVLKLLSI